MAAAPVAGVQGVSAATVGWGFTCAQLGDAAWCWGRNEGGQLGDGTTANRAAPAPVVGFGAGVRQLVAASAHVCAVTTHGGLRCWGMNAWGQLGDGSRIQRQVPVGVLGLASGVAAVAAGERHTCALLVGGEVRCWGDNSDGQLGTSHPWSPVPVTVPALPADTIAIAAGERHTCALGAHGTVRCWGATNELPSPGPEVGPAPGPGPAVVPLPAPAAEIAAGARGSCARLVDGRLVCWGTTEQGKLGTGDARMSAVPVSVLAGDFAVALVAATTPNPSVASTLVRIDVRAVAADLFAVGTVNVSRGGTWVCTARLQRGIASCDVALTPGTHTLRVDFSPEDGHLPASTTHVHVVQPQPGQLCSGFDDVDAADPLCNSVDWMRNRGITQGCSAFEFCPSAPVTRLAMAAFMQRAGDALAPTVVSRQSVGHVPVNSLACDTAVLAGANHPRRAYVDVVVSGMNAGMPAQLDLSLSATIGGTIARSTGVRFAAPTGVHVNARAHAHFDLPAAMVPASFAALISSTLPLFQLDGGGCSLRAVVVDRTETYQPFDEALP
jgi:hypothetical protein